SKLLRTLARQSQLPSMTPSTSICLPTSSAPMLPTYLQYQRPHLASRRTRPLNPCVKTPPPTHATEGTENGSSSIESNTGMRCVIEVGTASRRSPQLADGVR